MADRKRRVILIVLLSLVVSSCGDADVPADSPPAEGNYQLVGAQRYGWNELSDSTRPMTEKERLFGGAVLGQPTGILVGDEGDVYVADAAFKKIVVFSPEGDFLRLIVGGDGKGPGEFGRPGPSVFGPGGDLWVFDLWLQRLTRFSLDGRLTGTMAVPATITPRMLGLMAAPNLLFGARHARDSVPLYVAFDTLGHIVGEFPYPSADDMRFTRGTSLASGLGPTPDPDVLILAHPDVGTWSRVRGLTVEERRGTPLFPGASPYPYVESQYGIQTTNAFAQPANTGAFGDGTVFILVSGQERGEPLRGHHEAGSVRLRGRTPGRSRLSWRGWRVCPFFPETRILRAVSRSVSARGEAFTDREGGQLR